MRKVAFGGATLLAFAFLACSNFGSEDSPGGNTPGADGGDEAGDGSAPRDGFLLQPFPAEPPFVIQGKRIKIPVKIMRGAAFEEPVTITLATPPKGISQLGNAVITGDSVDVELEVDATFKQGVVELLFEARSERTVAQTGKPKIFVRGPAGSLDRTFGNDGLLDDVLAPLNDVHLALEILALQDRSFLVVAPCAPEGTGPVGTPDGDYCVAHRGVDGQPDLSYGKAGLARVVGGRGSARAIIADGKLVIAGSASNFRAQLWRLDSSGRVESGFGPANGYDRSTIGEVGTMGGLARDSQGRYLLAFQHIYQFKDRLAVLRVRSDGVADTSFGPEGYSTHPSIDTHSIHGMGMRGDQPIVSSDNTNTGIFALSQWSVGGGSDATFGTNGVGMFSGVSGSTASGRALGVVVLPDGKAIVPVQQASGIRLAMVAADGKALEAAFGNSGFADVPTASRSVIQLIAAPAGAFIVLTSGSPPAIDLTRILANGQADNGFGSGGSVTSDLLIATRMAMQGENRILVVGNRTATVSKGAVARFWN